MFVSKNTTQLAKITQDNIFVTSLMFILFLNGVLASSLEERSQTRFSGEIMTTSNFKQNLQEEWGGVGISMSLNEEAASILFDCAEGTIPESFETVDGSSFEVPGTFRRHTPGALREKFKPEAKPARYEGSVEGDEMSLKITLIEDDQLIGDFTLERGKSGKLRRCL